MKLYILMLVTASTVAAAVATSHTAEPMTPSITTERNADRIGAVADDVQRLRMQLEDEGVIRR